MAAGLAVEGLQAFRRQKLPEWQNFPLPAIDFQKISYYAAPKSKKKYDSLDQVDPELLATFAKLGIPCPSKRHWQGLRWMSYSTVFRSRRLIKRKLKELGIIFCSFGEAVREHPELVRKYVGSVVPYSDNIFAALNAAAFSDGSFVYIPKGVRCPMELVHLFPDQYGEYRPVRKDADHCR
jgi:Fe-S cluster assembly protein SufB